MLVGETCEHFLCLGVALFVDRVALSCSLSLSCLRERAGVRARWHGRSDVPSQSLRVRRHLSDLPFLRQGECRAGGDDEMVEHAHIDQRQCGFEVLGELYV